MDGWKFIAVVLYLLGAFAALRKFEAIPQSVHERTEREISNERPDLSLSRKEDYVVRHISIFLYIVFWPLMSFGQLVKGAFTWKRK